MIILGHVFIGELWLWKMQSDLRRGFALEVQRNIILDFWKYSGTTISLGLLKFKKSRIPSVEHVYNELQYLKICCQSFKQEFNLKKKHWENIAFYIQAICYRQLHLRNRVTDSISFVCFSFHSTIFPRNRFTTYVNKPPFPLRGARICQWF